MLIFLLLNALVLLLNILAWIIIVLNWSKMSLHESLCSTPGDCPILFNPNYVVGLVFTVVGALIVLDASQLSNKFICSL